VVRELISLAIDLLYSGGHHAILEEITSLAFCIFHPAAVYTVTVFHVIILAIHFQIALHHTNTGLLLVITEFILPELCPALDHLTVSLFILTEPARIALGIFHLADTHLAGRLMEPVSLVPEIQPSAVAHAVCSKIITGSVNIPPSRRHHASGTEIVSLA